jgi:hypothetical protein
MQNRQLREAFSPAPRKVCRSDVWSHELDWRRLNRPKSSTSDQSRDIDLHNKLRVVLCR